MVRQRTVLRLVVALALIAVLAGCTSLVMNFNVALDPEALSVAQGADGEITVTISHLIPIGVVPMPITIEIHDPPAYVSAEPLEIPAGIASDELLFSVAAGAPIGGPVAIEVRASNGMSTKELSFELKVVAPPD